MKTPGRLTCLILAALLLVSHPGFGEIAALAPGPGSTLTFTATQAGARFTGRFDALDAAIAFDPEALAESSFEVRVATASVNTDYGERDEILRGAEFFDVRVFPEAVFRAVLFTRRGADEFVAEGTLKIKDVEKPLQLAFQYSPGPNAAGQWLLTGSFVIDRLDFGVGVGEWRDPRWVGREVTVDFRLLLDGRRELTGS